MEILLQYWQPPRQTCGGYPGTQSQLEFFSWTPCSALFPWDSRVRQFRPEMWKNIGEIFCFNLDSALNEVIGESSWNCGPEHVITFIHSLPKSIDITAADCTHLILIHTTINNPIKLFTDVFPIFPKNYWNFTRAISTRTTRSPLTTCLTFQLLPNYFTI